MIPALVISAALVSAAWAYGATEPWAVHSLQALVFLAVAAGFAELRGARLSVNDPQFRAFWDRRWAYPAILLSGYVLLQAANASHVYSPLTDGLTPRSHFPFLPRSVSASISMGALAKLWLYLGIMMVVRAFIDTRRARQTLFGLLLLSGGCMSVLVLLQRAEHPSPPYPITGMFICDNNYAAFINLLLPMALCMGRAAHVRATMRHERSHPGYLLYMMAALMTASVILSGSRAGGFVSLGLILTWLLLQVFRERRRGALRLVLCGAGGLLLLCAVGGVALLFKAESFKHDLSSLYGLTVGLQGRRVLLKAILAMLGDRWLGGFGAGCFAAAFPYYQPSSLAGLYFSFAHNDWLQYICELGLIGTVLLGAVLAGVLPAETWRRLAVWPVRGANHGREGGGAVRSIRGRYERQGLILALAGLAVHALVDFPLHIPSIAAIAAAWVGLWGQEEPLRA